MAVSTATLLQVEARYSFDLVQILTADFEFLASGVEHAAAKVEPGVYVVRLCRPDGDHDRLHEVTGETGGPIHPVEWPLSPPLEALAVPSARPPELAPGVPLADASCRITVCGDTDSIGGGSARLTELEGKVVFEVRLDAATGPIAAEAFDVPCGQYSLEHAWPGYGPRVHSIVAAQGYETQVFLIPREPLVRMYIRPLGSGYERKAIESYAAVDAALDGLLRGEVILAADVIEQLREGRGDDPLLVLAGAWAAALRAGPDVLLARGGLARLERLLPFCADVDALRQVLGSDTGVARGAISLPPLLAPVTEKLLAMAATDAGLVPARSTLAQIAPRLRTGGPLTRWLPRTSPEADASLRRQVAELERPGGPSRAEIAQLFGLPPTAIPEVSRRLSWVARSRWMLWVLRRTPRHLVAFLRRARASGNRWLASVPQGPDALRPQPVPPAGRVLEGGALRPGERSSRVRARDAGWPALGKAAREPSELRLHWNAEGRPDTRHQIARTLLEGIGGRLVEGAHELVDSERERWIAARRAAGDLEASPDLVIARSDVTRCAIIGSVGDIDGGRDALLKPFMAIENAKPSDVLVLLGNVTSSPADAGEDVLPALDRLVKPILAVPGRHDWRDGLSGFMREFCGAQPLPPAPFAASSYTPVERLARWRWRRAMDPRRRSRRPRTDSNNEPIPRQPGPYWAMDIAGGVRLVAIDTGVNGSLDREQGEWLLRISRGPRAKVLLSGKAIWADAEYNPIPIDWGPLGAPEGRDTVDDIVRDAGCGYVAAISGEVHSYQRLTVTLGGHCNGDSTASGRQLEYVVNGAGARVGATHTVGRVGTTRHSARAVEPPASVRAPTEAAFRCYPTRGDSLALYAGSIGRKLVVATRAAAATLFVALAAVIGWEAVGNTPYPGLIRVMLAATLGFVAVPAVVAGAAIAASASFPPGYRAAGTVLVVALGAVLIALVPVQLAHGDGMWAWESALIALGVVVALPLGAALTQWLVTGPPLRRDLVACVVAVLLASMYVADIDNATTALLTVALGLIAIAALLRILVEVRKVTPAGALITALERAASIKGWRAAAIWATILAAVAVRFWDAWATRAAVAALIAATIAASLFVLGVLVVGGRRAIIDFGAGGIDPDQALSYLYEVGIVETLPRVRDRGHPARVDDFDYRTGRICEFLLPGSAGVRRRLSSYLSALPACQPRPLFRSWVTLALEGGELVITCHAATGSSEHVSTAPREDCVRIRLPARD